MLPILTTPLTHPYFKGWENVVFELGSERVENLGSFMSQLFGVRLN